MPMALLERALTIAGLLATAALLWRVWNARLTNYPSLVAYLVWHFAGAVPLMIVPRRSAAYFYAYACLLLVQWVIDVLVTLELVKLITSRYPGIMSASRIAVKVALAAAIVVALVSATIDLDPNATSNQQQLKALFLVDRTISVSVLGFLSCIIGFLLWFPVRLSRNVVAYAVGFIILFAAQIMTLLAGNLFGRGTYQALSLLDQTVFVAVACYWAVRMTATNERAQTVVGHAWNRTEENRLIEQLDSINATLMRTSTKGQPR